MDADRDDLTDYQESLLGTSPYRADSDGDLLPDKWEVDGFEYAGRQWVTDPLSMDSNRDGLSDTHEWMADADGDEMPDDSDGDGVPHVADFDNDGDGVPDRLDISPFAASPTFAQDEPFGLTFNNLAAGRPALVDFQLRPADADHLWYAFNVLDWPQGDAEGQMQDVDGRTFADMSGEGFMGQEANGDLRLVPMLEIEIEGPLTHLPAASELRQMGMMVQQPRDAQGRILAGRPAHVYLPLRLVTDADSGAQVAFEGTMLYRPEFDLWGAAHRARLAWLVQALVDVCVASDTSDAACDASQNNQPQVLHVYYEPWQLTGLDVREDHGVELAVLYEDPALDPEPHDDDALMMLAGGLAQTFLAGRDADGDGQPDITTEEIARRFAQDSDVNGAARWEIPQIVDVARRSYEHRAQAMATLVMTDTAAILAQRFSPPVEASDAISPTLMFAREERFRTLNLDNQVGSDLVRWRGSNLTVDLDPEAAPLQTLAGLSWAPYRYSEESQRWESFPIDDYWDLLAARYPFFEEVDPEVAAGKQFGLQLWYLSLYAGVSETVQFDGAIPPNLRSETDEALAATVLDHALNGVSYVINGYVAFLLDVGSTIDGFTWSDWSKVKELVTKTDRELGTLVGNLKARFNTLTTFGKGAVIAAMVLLLAGLILLTIFAQASLAARITLATVVGGLLLWLDVISPAYSVIQGIRGLVTADTGFFSAARAWLATSSGQSAVNAAKFAAVLALVITLVVVWVDFFITISRHDFQPGSIPFNILLSQAIAGTLVAALALALVFAFPIAGAIVVAIVGVWDLIMTIVGLDELVLTNQVTKFLADVFYGVNATLQEPAVTLQGRELALSDPEQGLVAGNELTVAATVLTEIEHNQPRHNVLAYLGRFYSDDNLDSTSFDYQLRAPQGSDTQPWSASQSWQPRRSERFLLHWLWRGRQVSAVPVVSLPLEGAGVNQVALYDFRVRYDLPGWECWGVSLLSYCDERRISGENGTVDATIVLDVFPATLEAFYALDWGAWRPSWQCPPDEGSEDYDDWLALGERCDQGLDFAAQRDHDGDGLLAQAAGGLDADDTRWDTDGDGLSDRYEMELAEGGQGVVLHLAADSDGDGLCDDQELRWGADASLADSDGDGLLDGEEVLHRDRCDGDGDGDTAEWLGGWTFVYDSRQRLGAQTTGTLISSNPRQADGDGDGLNDRAEKQLHQANPVLYPYHPAVYNETAVALYSSVSDDDRILAPGQTVVYTATVRNTLAAPLSSSGALTVTLPAALGGERLTAPFNLYRAQQQTETRLVQVAAGTTSGEVSIEQVVDARLHRGDFAPLFSWRPPRRTAHVPAGDLAMVGATVAAPGVAWEAPFLVAVLRGEDEGGECSEEVACATVAIELSTISAGGEISETVTVDTFQDFETSLIGSQPELTFSDDGNGLLVYTRPYCEGDGCQPAPTVMGVALAPGLMGDMAPFPISATGGDSTVSRVEAVQVTGDGNGFLVLWEAPVEGGRAIQAARVSASGMISAVSGPAVASVETLLDLAWDGESYLLLWTAEGAQDSHQLRLTALGGADPLPVAAEYELASSVPQALEAQMAIDPDSRRALIVYGADGVPLRARTLAGEALSPEMTLWQPAEPLQGMREVQVAFDAAHRGWLASWLATAEAGKVALNYQALDASGQLRLSRQAQALVPAATGATLACAAQATGCVVVAHEATTLDVASLALDPLATAIERPLPLLIDADPPTSTIVSLQNGQYISTTGTLVVGGLAGDATSRIASVDVRVNGEPCLDVVGAAVWAATCAVPEEEGPFTIAAQATDVVGNEESAASQVTAIVDRQPPQVGFTQGADGVLVAAQAAGGQAAEGGLWLVALEGEVQDPAAGGAPGSGAARVEARLDWQRSWQAAVLEGNGWRLDYRLPTFDAAFNVLSDPTGVYTFALRAFDGAGNMTVLPPLVVRVDNQPPAASLISPEQTMRVISQTLTLSGLLTETGPIQAGVSQLALALTPANFVISPTTWLPAELARSGPGVISSTWRATIPAGLEGIYQLDVRGTDVFGNANDDRSTWNQWQGEIDTLAPRPAITVTYSGAGSSAQTTYQFWAQDFNLASTTFEPACATAPRYETYSEPWWDETIGDRTRIYTMAGSCRVTGLQSEAVSLEACDRFGRCSLASEGLPAVPDSVAEAPILHSAVLTPTHETVLADDASVELIIGAHATDGLAAATVLVDGTLVARTQWDDAPLDTLWTTEWQPPGEGFFTLTSIVTDTVGRVQTDTSGTRVGIDLSPPQVSLATTVLTTTHQLAAGRVDLTGTASDATGVVAVEVQVDDGPWLPAVLLGEEWIFPWQIGDGVDGQQFDVAVRAIDGAGRMDEVRRAVVVDILPPEPARVTLAVIEDGGARRVVPGDTVRQTPARLVMRWTAGGDTSGDAVYLAGWSTSPTPEAAALTPYPATGAHEQMVGEAQAVYAHLVIRDQHGNTTPQSLGPIIVDGASTPDYVSDLGYHGWQNAATSLVGVNWATARRAATGSALNSAQRLYASWDGEGLRLSWTGANWNRDGDLFVYLDTGGEISGSRQLYNPYDDPDPAIALPEGMAAGYVVQVEDSRGATLWRWDGDGWTGSEELGGDLFAHDTVVQPARTDLYLPFELLGMDDPDAASLSLLAIASEEEALRLWATIPDKNPLNSERVIDAAAVPFVDDDYQLMQALTLAMLGDGQAPNGGLRAGADLQWTITAKPPGAAFAYLESGLPQLQPGARLDEGLDGRLDPSLPLDTEAAPLADGTVVTYTIGYANRGEATAEHVVLDVAGYGALLLPEEMRAPIELGDVGPGITGTLVLTATVDVSRTQNIASAELDVTVSDLAHGAFDWLWVQHDVDASPPVASATSPQVAVALGPLLLQGTVDGPAAIGDVTVAIRTWLEDEQALTFCTDTVVERGRWTCPWQPDETLLQALAASYFDGAALSVQVRATDVFGRRGEWSMPLSLPVDREAPLLALSPETAAYLDDGLLNAAELHLTGVLSDTQQAGDLEICVDEAPCERIRTSEGAWHHTVDAPEETDGRMQRLTLRGFDRVGNASEMLTLAYTIDVQAPALSLTEHVTTTAQATVVTTVLTGTVGEGSGPPTMTVRIQPPSGPARVEPVDVQDGAWRVGLAPDMAGLYQFIVEAVDEAGNLRVMPAVSLLVTAAEQPPESGQPLLPAQTQISSTFVPYLRSGGFVRLIVEPPLPAFWTQVQWQDAAGKWHDVDGWRGTYYRGNEVLWWVAERELGTGPYRWVVTDGPGGPTLAVSAAFTAPGEPGGEVTVRLIPAGSGWQLR